MRESYKGVRVKYGNIVRAGQVTLIKLSAKFPCHSCSWQIPHVPDSLQHEEELLLP